MGGSHYLRQTKQVSVFFWEGGERRGGEEGREGGVVVVVQTVEGTRVSVQARTCGAANSGSRVLVDMTPDTSILHEL